MTRKFKIDSLDCLCRRNSDAESITFILYPMDCLSGWIDYAAQAYGTSIAVLTGFDWDNDLTPWPAKGVPAGSPDFKGNAPDLLSRLKEKVIPGIEREMGLGDACVRNLVGVSLSGLFAMWQWAVCDLFSSVASLSGSFWYDGFADWFASRRLPEKRGMAYLSLGDTEANSKVKAFQSVAADTEKVVSALEKAGIRTVFESVPGNHYADPLPRLERAFRSLYKDH